MRLSKWDKLTLSYSSPEELAKEITEEPVEEAQLTPHIESQLDVPEPVTFPPSRGGPSEAEVDKIFQSIDWSLSADDLVDIFLAEVYDRFMETWPEDVGAWIQNVFLPLFEKSTDRGNFRSISAWEFIYPRVYMPILACRATFHHKLPSLPQTNDGSTHLRTVKYLLQEEINIKATWSLGDTAVRSVTANEGRILGRLLLAPGAKVSVEQCSQPQPYCLPYISIVPCGSCVVSS